MNNKPKQLHLNRKNNRLLAELIKKIKGNSVQDKITVVLEAAKQELEPTATAAPSGGSVQKQKEPTWKDAIKANFVGAIIFSLFIAFFALLMSL